MNIDTKDLLNSILESISRLDYIHAEELPDIDLYMDQVTTFMEQKLSSAKRCPQDKVLTKTMINNYAKNRLLPSPEKKKYSKEHLLLLIFIYYFKNILSINDIQALFAPITQKYFQGGDSLNLTEIYREVFQMEQEQMESLKEDLKNRCQISQKAFSQVEDEQEQEFLQIFSFICLLSFDIYTKKMIVETLIDSLRDNPSSKKEDEPRKK